jgi:hypothetical protein
MRRGLLLLSTVLIALTVVAGAAAGKPDRYPFSATGDMPIPADQCGFPILLHIEGAEINWDFFDKDGNLAKRMGVFPGQTSTWTNLDTGESITLSDAGLYQLRLEPDGSGSVSITGHGYIPNDATGEPGIWYLNGGHVAARFDADGNATSIKISGNLINLCTLLAP